jgi:heme oxygenase (biliverdin-IX-beta and delta-forming)
LGKVRSMSLLAEIRTRSEPMHRHLESVLDIPKQVTTPNQYAALLARFTALYQPWEARLESFREDFAKLGINLSERGRVPNLQRDLAALDANVRLPGAEAYAPALPGFPEALGSLYVLEGSTLGGQVLTRHFRDAMGIEEGALHFFASHGPNVGRLWKDFCAALNAYGESAGAPERERVVQGAVDSFAAITRWFSDRPVN